MGRISEIAQINALLANESRCERVAIVGLGGVGKTQVALEFAHQWREKHADCAVFWIPVTNVESMLEAYLEVGRQLQIPNLEQEKAEVQKLVQRRLSQESFGRWLLVFDNADDINVWTESAGSITGSSRRIDHLPKSKHGSILFTSRSRRAATKLAGKNVVSVGEMDDTMAKALLESSLTDRDLLEDDQATADLLLKLTYLPLAIVQAAAYINEIQISLSEYSTLLDDTEQDTIDILSEEFEDEGRYVDIKNPIATTWLISFEQIRTCDPLAAEYLSFMACVDAKDIPQSLLPPAQSAKKAVDAIGTLTAYSFVTKHKTDQVLDLHRLVHLATRNWLRTEKSLGQWAAKVIQRLEYVFPDSDHTNRSVWRMYLPHARYALDADFEEIAGEAKMGLLWTFAGCTRSDGRYKEAEEAYRKVMEGREKALGKEHPDTLTSVSNLALALQDQGKYEAAEEMNRRALEGCEKALGKEHPDTLTSVSNLALVLQYQGKYEAAEEMNRRALEGYEKALGKDHPDTLTSVSILALTYTNQGQWKEAEELQVQVMETRKRLLGDEHPDTLTAMNNLAFTLQYQSRNEEAISLMGACFQLRKKTLGSHHPYTKMSFELLNEWRIGTT